MCLQTLHMCDNGCGVHVCGPPVCGPPVSISVSPTLTQTCIFDRSSNASDPSFDLAPQHELGLVIHPCSRPSAKEIGLGVGEGVHKLHIVPAHAQHPHVAAAD